MDRTVVITRERLESYNHAVYLNEKVELAYDKYRNDPIRLRAELDKIFEEEEENESES